MKMNYALFNDIGIDLGTANTLIYLRRHGIVSQEPSVAAINKKTGHILAVGEDAKKMLGRTPSHVSVIRPLVSGVISDFDTTHELLRKFIRKTTGNSFFGIRRAVLGIPDGLTEVERKSVEDAARHAGCSKVYLVESPVAVALGAGLPIEDPTASLIVDIGGGTTDIAVISMGGIVVSKTLKVAGDKFNDDIIRFMRDEFRLEIGEPTAEFAKITAGSAVPLEDRVETEVRGRDYSTGLPRAVLIKSNHINAALEKSLKSIVDSVKEVIGNTPPELAGDMIERGIYLSGGGSLLRGMDKLIKEGSSVKTSFVDDPDSCMVQGLGKMVDAPRDYKSYFDNPLKPMEIKL